MVPGKDIETESDAPGLPAKLIPFEVF